MDKYEFPDATKAALGGQQKTDAFAPFSASGGYSASVPFKTLDVIEPATGRSLGRRQCIDINQSTLVQDPATSQVAYLPSISQIFKPNNASGWTVFVRCRPHASPLQPTGAYVLYNVRNYWGANAGGFFVMLNSNNSSALKDDVRVKVQFGNTGYTFTDMTGDYALKTNRWTDLVLSVTTNVATLYSIREGGKLFKASYTIPFEQNSNIGSYFTLGALDNHNNGIDQVKAYHGCAEFSDVAAWNRGISEDEVLDLLQCPQTDYARVGVENGSSGEFAAQGSGCVTNGTWGEWRDFPGTLSAGRTATFSFVLPANCENVNQILSLTTVPGSPVGPLPVKVNGSSVGDLTFGAASRKACLLISRENLVAGTNTVEIAANASAAVEIDTISVGGGWQVGVANGKGEGENTKLYTYTFNVGLSSTTNLSASLRTFTYWGTSSTSPDEWRYLTTRNAESFRFRVPESFLGGANNACRFVFRPLKASSETWAPEMSSTQEYTYRLYANGVKIGEAKALASSATTVKFNVPMSVFADSRECVLKIVNETEPWYTPTDYYYDPKDENRKKYQYGCYYWNKIDYFSFEPFDCKGLIMVIR